MNILKIGFLYFFRALPPTLDHLKSGATERKNRAKNEWSD